MLQTPLSWDQAKEWREKHRKAGKRVVFTNGCFDILHPGHVDLLNKCRNFGDVLILGLNSDSSINRIKGSKRPIVAELDRAAVLLGLSTVDEVVIFDQDTPGELINTLLPDVLVKGGDWSPDKVVGRDSVVANGGKVEIIPLVEGRSTTNVVDTIIERYCDKR
jgi:D-beta-D-heptose 7-phosphate kinase / D-beta-D-heptose 1-phosphate adenosyltransferase